MRAGSKEKKLFSSIGKLSKKAMEVGEMGLAGGDGMAGTMTHRGSAVDPKVGAFSGAGWREGGGGRARVALKKCGQMTRKLGVWASAIRFWVRAAGMEPRSRWQKGL